MNPFIEEFIKKFYLNDEGQDVESALEEARKLNISSIETLIDFLLSSKGFANRTFSQSRRNSFFKTYPEYAGVQTLLIQRENQFKNQLPKIKVSPLNDITASHYLSVSENDFEIGTDSNDMHISIRHIANGGGIDAIMSNHNTIPIFFSYFPEMQLKFWGMFPLMKINGEVITYKDFLKRARSVIKQNIKNQPDYKTLNHFLHRILLEDQNFSSGSPILAYRYNNGIILDTPEFKGQKGEIIWAQNSYSRRSLFIVDNNNVVHEYKGSRLDLLSEYLVPQSLSPPGACSLGAAQTEAKTVESLSDILPYKAGAIDLDFKAPVISLDNPDEMAYLNLGLLKREGALDNFTPHLRINKWEMLPFTWLLRDYNFDFEKPFWNIGYQLGTAHSRSIYPLYNGTDNIDFYGNLIDLEGAINNERFWKLFAEWSAKSAFYSDGNPLIKKIHVEYEHLFDEEGHRMNLKVIQNDPDSDLGEPKDWNELKNFINNYGIRIFELASLNVTLVSVVGLLCQFEENQFLRGKQDKFLNNLLDGYRYAYDNPEISPLIERYRELLPYIGWSDRYSTALTLAITITYGIEHKKIPYVQVPRDFQFVDRNHDEIH